MKKIILLALASLLCIGMFTGCGNSKSNQAWTFEDFSFYDDSGREIAFPVGDYFISLADINEEKGGNYQTKRGVRIGDRAIAALEKYKIDGFHYRVHYFWGDGTASKDEAERQDEKTL